MLAHWRNPETLDLAPEIRHTRESTGHLHQTARWSRPPQYLRTSLSPNASAQRRPCNGGAAAMKRASGGRRPRIDAPCYVLLEMAVNAPATTSYAQIHQQVSLLLAHKVWIF